jgi:hypothetical protein
MKSFSFITLFFLLTTAVFSQNSFIGKWKRISNFVINANGTKTDIQADMVKYKPCIANIVYEFIAGGKTLTNAAACDAAFKKMIEKTEAQTTWVQKGNKVTTSTKDGSIPATECTISFMGNTMTWTAAKTIIVYQRL